MSGKTPLRLRVALDEGAGVGEAHPPVGRGLLTEDGRRDGQSQTRY